MSTTSIYETLTAIPNDPVGVFAYIAYKQQKIEYCKSFGDREPTREELDSFHAVASLDGSIDAYRVQGEAMAQIFWEQALMSSLEILSHLLDAMFCISRPKR